MVNNNKRLGYHYISLDINRLSVPVVLQLFSVLADHIIFSDDRTTGTLSTYAPTAREAGEKGVGGIVHFDIERRQIGKTVKPDISILADCRYCKDVGTYWDIH